MTSNADSFQDALQAVVVARIPGVSAVHSLRHLSAGASMETWSFDAESTTGTIPLILRRRPPGNAQPEDFAGLGTEASVIQAAVAAGVKAPIVRYVLQPDDRLGGGFLMERIEGETIARKILRDPAFQAIHHVLLKQIAETAAHIHAVPLDRLPPLKMQSVAQTLDEWRQEYRSQGQSRPVFELTLRYLRDHEPKTPFTPRLVHGDYRMGNLIVGPEGLRAVLDWELCHIGDPMHDLAWLCLHPWRFGKIDSPAGGLGSREALYSAYENASGERLDRTRLRYWEIFGSLRWGLMCSGMVDWFRSGRDRSVERAMIARRASESELDLLRILEE
ncbi:aminoglycoside phosphotransferase (APT) family kinase protein [Povalibacter uvarum]|uniref:Aminoglycoside phosphotransferase (APT) family kinase protein n=1 Tax=Povalibacter uvarum TaxID=732238 RepID=A0A841HUK8_9GAMM|nr:phosphotransferase family protein [Povalibacter uvarum]MBB6096334.1 aminoglycoside phosphotransferase (APT) family kinase protein [Povalibacter uvarum]